jgi:type II secretory pathway component PulK
MMRPSQPHRGAILPVVLFILILLGLFVATFSFRIHADVSSSRAVVDRMQTRLAAEAGVERVKLMLAVERTNVGAWYNNPDELHRIIVWTPDGDESTWGSDDELDDGAVAFRFSLVADDWTDDEDFIRYGITDEGAKLNLNLATEDQLQRLVVAAVGDDPEINPLEVVDAVLDWRDADDNPRDEETPAEQEFYNELDEPYRCKNGPLDSVEELLLVRGMTGLILYGEDYDRNGLLTDNEDDGDETFPFDNQDSVLNRGIYPYLTTMAYESNVDDTNRMRFSLFSEQAALQEELALVFEENPEVAQYVAQQMQGWTAPQGSIGQTATPSGSGEGDDSGDGDEGEGDQESGDGSDGEGDSSAFGEDGDLPSYEEAEELLDGVGGDGDKHSATQKSRVTDTSETKQQQPGSRQPGSRPGGRRPGRGGDNPGAGGQGGGDGVRPGRGEGGPPGGEGGRPGRGGEGGRGGRPGRGGQGGTPGSPGGGGSPGMPGSEGDGGSDGEGAGGDGSGGDGSGDGGAGSNVMLTVAELMRGSEYDLEYDGMGFNPLTIDDLAILLDKTTVYGDQDVDLIVSGDDPENPQSHRIKYAASTQQIQGLINVNTAPPQVLSLLPGLSEEQAYAIAEAREGIDSESRTTIAWLLGEELVDLETFIKIAPLITARGQQFNVQALGYADHLGIVTRLEVVLDMIGPLPQVIYYRDISRLGGRFPIREEDEERNIRVR